MKLTRRDFFKDCLKIGGAVCMGNLLSGCSEEKLYPIAIKDFDFFYENNGGIRDLKTRVWYADCDEKFPLILLSHGYTGTPMAPSLIGKALARRGYIVAAPFHNDSILENPFALWNPDWSYFQYRIDDCFTLLDNLLFMNKNESELVDRIDGGKIGVGGISLGGWTTVQVANQLNHENKTNENIKAALLLSPARPTHENAELDMPTMWMTGTEDDIREDVIKGYEKADVPKYFLEIKGAGHLVFSCTRSYLELIREPGEFIFNRPQVMEDYLAKVSLINFYSCAFFDKHLKNESSANLKLASMALNPWLENTDYKFEGA